MKVENVAMIYLEPTASALRLKKSCSVMGRSK